MVAKASNFLAQGDGWNFLQYLVSYICFVVGSMTGGMLVNYETFYLVRSFVCVWNAPCPARHASDVVLPPPAGPHVRAEPADPGGHPGPGADRGEQLRQLHHFHLARHLLLRAAEQHDLQVQRQRCAHHAPDGRLHRLRHRARPHPQGPPRRVVEGAHARCVTWPFCVRPIKYRPLC